jgi:hypothetical protein
MSAGGGEQILMDAIRRMEQCPDARLRALLAGASILRREEPGAVLTLKGVISSEKGFPLAGAKVEVWQTAGDDRCVCYNFVLAADPA